MLPKVSIIILNWNGLKDTIQCLDSLKKITYPNYEVVVVDNGSKGNDADVLEEKYQGDIRLIRNKENLGFAEGNNVAIREIIKEGQSKYILFLNNDTTVEPDFLDKLVECAEKHPKAGSIQPKLIWAFHPKLFDSAGLEYSRTGFGFDRGKFRPIGEYNQEEEILAGCGAALFCRVEVLEDIKINNEYFDSDFFATYEDFDLGIRMRWAGWQNWYCPESVVYHFRGKSLGTRSKFSSFYGTRNQTWCLFKNFPASFVLKNLYFIIPAQIAQIGINLIKGRFSLLPSIIKGRIEGYSGLGKILKKKKKIKKNIHFSEIEKFIIACWRAYIPKKK